MLKRLLKHVLNEAPLGASIETLIEARIEVCVRNARDGWLIGALDAAPIEVRTEALLKACIGTLIDARIVAIIKPRIAASVGARIVTLIEALVEAPIEARQPICF